MVRVPKGVPGLPEGTKPGGVCDKPVNLVSLHRTLTDLAGLPAKQGIDGNSLVPLLRDPDADWPHVALTHLHDPGNYSISGERFRYIRYHDGGEELYDIATDPHEWTNLAGDPTHAETLKKMRALAPSKDEIKPRVDTK